MAYTCTDSCAAECSCLLSCFALNPILQGQKFRKRSGMFVGSDGCFGEGSQRTGKLFYTSAGVRNAASLLLLRECSMQFSSYRAHCPATDCSARIYLQSVILLIGLYKCV